MGKISGGTGPLQNLPPINNKKQEAPGNPAPAPNTTAPSNQDNSVEVNTSANAQAGFGNEAGLDMGIAQGLKAITTDTDTADADQAVELAMGLIEEHYPELADKAASVIGDDYDQVLEDLQKILDMMPDPKAHAEFKKGLKQLTKGPGC